MENFYVTVVFEDGVPMFTRHLSEDEALRLFDMYGSIERVVFCQYGDSSTAYSANAYCRGATF